MIMHKKLRTELKKKETVSWQIKLFGRKFSLPRGDIMLRCLNVIVCCKVNYSITQALDSEWDVKIQKQYCQCNILAIYFTQW